MKNTLSCLLTAAFAATLGMLATAAAFGQGQATLQKVDYEIINGPKKACPAEVNFTGHLQVKVATTTNGTKVTYQWVRSDGKTIGPTSIVLQGGARAINYTWSLAKSYSGSAELQILTPSKQSAKASFALNCSKTN